MFDLLITVSGVGPKVALAILSVLPPDSLRRAVAAQDAAALTLVPGVGKKVAGRVLLDLKDSRGRQDSLAYKDRLDRLELPAPKDQLDQ